jgi:hypothetical protein
VVTITGLVDLVEADSEIAAFTISSYYKSQNYTLNSSANTFDLEWTVTPTDGVDTSQSDQIYNLTQSTNTCHVFSTVRPFYVGESFKVSFHVFDTYSSIHYFYLTFN